MVITGASSGIGLATAQLAAQEGARVALLGRREDRLKRATESLVGSGHTVREFDITNYDSIPALFEGLVAEMGPLHALVNAAGAHHVAPLRAETVQDANALLNTNVTATLMMTKGFRRKGVAGTDSSVVLISSASAVRGEAGIATYAASKGALLSLARSLAVELARERIRVNAVSAGLVQTPLAERLHSAVGDEAWENAVAAHPLGIGEPEDVAHAILFLVSPVSRWVTGSTLAVDGGMTA